MKYKDLTGLVFGRLTVLSKSPKHGGRISWICKCECNNFTTVLGKNLQNLNTTSCGCKNPNLLLKDKSPYWKGFGEISLSVFNKIKTRAVERNYEFDVTIDYIWDLFLKQNRKCIYSDIDLCFKPKASSYTGTASLDRIDNTKGYVEGNVHWIHKQVNYMKHTQTENEFLEWCNKISEHQKWKMKEKIELM